MKFLILIFIFINLYAQEIKIQIKDINSTLKNHSGIVIKNINNSEVAIAKILYKDKITYKPLDFINKNLANLNISPSKNDIAIFNINYNRALLITNNQQNYQKITSKYQKQWIHPDIFTTTLSSIPTKKDFQNFCNRFNVGLVYFDLDKLYVVDCNTFKPIKTLPTTKKTYKKPFFNTYNELKTTVFSSKKKDFIKYYNSLIK